MVIVSLLPRVEFGPNDHRNDAPHFYCRKSKIGTNDKLNNDFYFIQSNWSLRKQYFRMSTLKFLQIFSPIDIKVELPNGVVMDFITFKGYNLQS